MREPDPDEDDDIIQTIMMIMYLDPDAFATGRRPNVTLDQLRYMREHIGS